MKITTFNVNGVRAIFNKEGVGWINGLDGILGLQEIKAKRQVPGAIQSIDVIRRFGIRLNGGYSGTAAFIG